MKSNQPFQNPSPQRKTKGFTLIELLIAMTIGSIITLAAYQIFFSTKRSLALLETESRMQEDARFAFSFIASKLQQAGDFGCQIGTEDTMDSLLDLTNDTFRPWRNIEGWEALNTGYDDTYTATLDDTVINPIDSSNWSTSDGATLDTGIRSKRKSDILKIWYSSEQKTELTSATAGVLTFPAIDLKRGNILVINDCSTIKLVQVCRCDTDDGSVCTGDDQRADLINCAASAGIPVTNPGNLTNDISDINTNTAEIRTLEEAIFYVSKRSYDRYNPPSLYWKNLGTNARPSSASEILEGVESLQLLYGEDTDNDKSANYYVSANDVSNWDNVTSIRISLLLISKNSNLITDTQTLSFNNNDITIDSEDHHLRKVFTTTIALRNRITGY